jgi:hypothetical protein
VLDWSVDAYFVTWSVDGEIKASAIILFIDPSKTRSTNLVVDTDYMNLVIGLNKVFSLESGI